MLDLAGLPVPVLGAPMAGGPTTPELVSAVSGAGGLGFLAAGYRSAEAVAAEVEAVRTAGSVPFGVNLFLVEPFETDPTALDSYARSLQPEAARLGVDVGTPRWDDDDYRTKVELMLELRPDVVSFTFGCPDADVLTRLRQHDVLTMVTVTSVAEARTAVARGAASLTVQGPDAGGHRGTWQLDRKPDSTPLPELVSAVVAAVDVPVAAAGGLGSAADVASALTWGAVAAQVGTAYLRCDEAGTHPVHRAALTDPAFGPTAVTRAYTGRWARGLANRFIAGHTDAPAGYPQVLHLTAPLRRAALSAGDGQVAQLWAGRKHAGIGAGAAADITRSLAP